MRRVGRDVGDDVLGRRAFRWRMDRRDESGRRRAEAKETLVVRFVTMRVRPVDLQLEGRNMDVIVERLSDRDEPDDEEVEQQRHGSATAESPSTFQ